MNRLDSHSTAPAFAVLPDSVDPGPARRLLVLMPDPEADSINAARRVWELASSLQGRVHLLGLCHDEVQEASLRRRMVTLGAMVSSENLPAESRVEFSRDWLDAVRKNWQEGDVVVCFAGQPAGLGHRSLGDLLESNLNVTVHVLDGVYPIETPRPQWVASLMAWSGSLGLIAGFLWLQVRLTSLSNDWAHTALMYLSILLEIGAVWGWNSLFS